MVSPFLLPFSPQRFTLRCAGVRLGHGIEVAIDIRRGAHSAYTEYRFDIRGEEANVLGFLVH